LGTIKINEIKLDFYVFFTYLYYVIKIKRYGTIRCAWYEC
jgi:hypothetical protein